MIFLAELSRYLHHDASAVLRFAKREGLVRKVSLGHYGSAEYVSPYGAMRIIAYIRAIQGEHYLQQKNFHEFNEKEALRKRLRKLLPIAIPRAATESQGQPAATEPDGACPRL